MDMMETGGKTELALAPGVYAYMQDAAQGTVKTCCGPQSINQTGQERPVEYDPETRRFTSVGLEEAVKTYIHAAEGDYVVLENPTEQDGDGYGQFPQAGASPTTPALKQGTSINIPGPISFALWPGQDAEVIKGHNLRSNQYLVVMIYNEDEAQANWGQGIIAAAESTDDEEQPDEEAEETTETSVTDVDVSTLKMGTMLVIKGTEVSFYLPPTGVRVLAEEGGDYVREALTLERLEYCILIDENGNKRYERGPKVVFPEPTEQFEEKDGAKKWKVEELNAQQGIHIKVIAPYTDDGTEYSEGQEIFITGDQQAIYCPRPEHSIIKYGGRTKHYATAIPVGEGRYILDRDTGEVKTEVGPQMLLPNPVEQVIVKRPLSEDQSELWYPGNEESKAYNAGLREKSRQTEGRDFVEASEAFGLAFDAEEGVGAKNKLLRAGMQTETFQRGTKYTPPRTVTLDTKYDCVPVIQPWTGYAVMVVDRSGNRRVEQGPTTVLMEYDETLEVLELSTGKPKNTDRLERTVYLRTKNNKVSDIIEGVETKDHVPLHVKLSFRVNFEGDDPKIWFEVENYVKLLTDHVRSMVKGRVRKLEIEEFYEDGTAILRDLILGQSVEGERPGLKFEENGMRVNDVEVLEIKIDDPTIAQLLDRSQHETVASNIALRQSERQLKVAQREEEIAQDKAKAVHETQILKDDLEVAKIKNGLKVTLEASASELAKEAKQEEIMTAKEKTADISSKANLARKQDAAEFEEGVEKAKLLRMKEQLVAETESTTKRFEVAQQGFSEALLALKDAATLEKVANALSVQNVLGKNFGQVIQDLFKGSPLEPAMKKVAERAGVLNIGNGED
jgi:major vault protein